MYLPVPTQAFNLTMLRQPVPPSNRHEFDGWCFGLPPGIQPEAWPISHASGYPLRHAFTVRVPEAYRTHGPDKVAISVFFDEFEPDFLDGLANLLAQDPPANETVPPRLLPFLRQWQHRHPQSYRMDDPVGHPITAIWLGEAEFSAEWCQPPQLRSHLDEDPVNAPSWWTKGSARAFFDQNTSLSTAETEEEWKRYWVYRWFGERPPLQHVGYALQLSLREGDINAGRRPSEDDPEDDHDYIDPYSQTGEALKLAEQLSAHRFHFGGTMFPAQGIPEVSPFYLEFDEQLGGWNLAGDGVAQLDLASMTFHWECG